MLALCSLAALLLAQFLPGLLLVKLLDVGRDREERFVIAAVFSGPLAALIYLLALLAKWEPLYWILVANAALLALTLPWRSRRGRGFSRSARVALLATVAGVLLPYLLTTGHLYRPDAEGNLLLGRGLQRDVLFHVGVTRSLENDYPPSLLSVSGTPIGYHVGYHLQLAAWARHFGIDAFDGLVRVAPIWQITLLVSSAFLLARRFFDRRLAPLFVPALVLGSGLGFLVAFQPSVEWWSLAFLDVGVVSVLLPNSFLPALPLLFVGLVLLDDAARDDGRGALLGQAYGFAALLVVKVFIGAQVLAALALGALVDRRLRVPFVVTSLAASPFLAHTFFAALGSNTRIGLRPLEIVRYSMEKIGWDGAVEALAAVGRLELSSVGLAFVATALWVLGFLGPRLLGLGAFGRDLLRGAVPLRRTMAWFVAVGFAVALVFRIAPAEAEGLSRLEAQNDVVWFAAASGVLLWFWTASALRRRGALIALTAVALIPTVQHFFHAASLTPDRVGAETVRSARAAASLSPPSAVWLDPLDRSRPSPLPYLAGRAVVYDPYVGYDYMFVGRAEVDYRRHAVAQFWASPDPSYRAWVLERFDVGFVWQRGSELPPLRALVPVYSDGAEHLFRVHARALTRAPELEMATPRSISMGNRGTPYLGSAFRRSARVRELAPGHGTIYLPRAAGKRLHLAFRFEPGHGGGELLIDGRGVVLEGGSAGCAFDLPAREVSGLHAIDVEWRGDEPLRILDISAH